MDALDKGILTKKVIVTGSLHFWQAQLQHVFTKEGWMFIELPEDYPDPQAMLQVHGNSVILYVLEENQNPVTGTRSVHQLLDMLRISQVQSVQAFYLISTLAVSAADSKTAAMAECIVVKWAAMTGIPTGIIHLPDVYGPGDGTGESLLDRCLLASVGGNSTVLSEEGQSGTRSFLYVDDAVYGIYRAVSRHYQGEPLDLVSDVRLTVTEFNQFIHQLTGGHVLAYLSDDTITYAQPVFSGRSAQDELGWRIKYDLKQGAGLAWDAAQSAVSQQGRQRRRNQWRSAWRNHLRRVVPYLENLAGAALMLGTSDRKSVV